jgi:hypothetical protein
VVSSNRRALWAPSCPTSMPSRGRRCGSCSASWRCVLSRGPELFVDSPHQAPSVNPPLKHLGQITHHPATHPQPPPCSFPPHVQGQVGGLVELAARVGGRRHALEAAARDTELGKSMAKCVAAWPQHKHLVTARGVTGSEEHGYGACDCSPLVQELRHRDLDVLERCEAACIRHGLCGASGGLVASVGHRPHRRRLGHCTTIHEKPAYIHPLTHSLTHLRAWMPRPWQPAVMVHAAAAAGPRGRGEGPREGGGAGAVPGPQVGHPAGRRCGAHPPPRRSVLCL